MGLLFTLPAAPHTTYLTPASPAPARPCILCLPFPHPHTHIVKHTHTPTHTRPPPHPPTHPQVHPAWQRNGLGRALVERLTASLVEDGIATITLYAGAQWAPLEKSILSIR